MAVQQSGTQLTIRRVDYFDTVVQDRPGEAYRLLSTLSGEGLNLLAFNAIPMGLDHTQLVLFPEDSDQFADVADRLGLRITGSHHAFLVQGDDRLGALADVHVCLYDAGVNVYASYGVTDGRGGYGYVMHVRPEDFERASNALGI